MVVRPVAMGHAQNVNTIQLFATGMDCEIACTVALILLVAGLAMEPILVHKECPSLTPNVIDFLSPACLHIKLWCKFPVEQNCWYTRV